MSPLERRLAEIGLEFGHGLPLGLDRIEAALERLGRPQDRLPPIIHVAGTNGKGSVCAYLRAFTEAAGGRAHVYTSPHLVRVQERIRVASRLADEDALLDAFARIAATGVQLTYFEVLTAAALLLFCATPADLCVMEVGMGGRFDATNVVSPAVSVIAPVDYDHQEFLGGSLQAIAAEKAGILKPNRPGVIARQAPEAMQAIEARAQAIGAPLLRFGMQWDAFARGGRLVVQTEEAALDLPEPSLLGAHQFENAGLAAVAMLALNQRFQAEALARGVTSARWPARLQPITRGALCAQAAPAELWLDGGHNAHAARALAQSLRGLEARRPARLALLWGMLARKDAAAFLAPLAALAPLVVAVPVQGEGPQPCHEPEHLCAQAAAAGLEARTAKDLSDAVAQARSAGAERILIAGSLFLAGEALRLSGLQPD